MRKYRFDIMNDRYVEIDTGKEVDGNAMDKAMEFYKKELPIRPDAKVNKFSVRLTEEEALGKCKNKT